ncbi:MAG: transposase [Aeoliella sp.]
MEGTMAKRQRRRFTGTEKTSIVKQHLVDKVAVSDLCDELGLQPTQFYQWQKKLFENGAKAFEQSSKTGKMGTEESRVAVLEATIVRRNAALAELLDSCLNGFWLQPEHRERLAGSRGRQ